MMVYKMGRLILVALLVIILISFSKIVDSMWIGYSF